MFQKGDLLICVANDVRNPLWAGIRPEIGCYYTWRGNGPEPDCGYVEEIISPRTLTGFEYAHAMHWYKKVEEVDITEIQEIISEPSEVLV